MGRFGSAANKRKKQSMKTKLIVFPIIHHIHIQKYNIYICVCVCVFVFYSNLTHMIILFQIKDTKRVAGLLKM